MRRTASQSDDGGVAGSAASPERSGKSKRSRSEEPLPVRIRRAAMDSLARREHAFVELRRKLLQKFVDQIPSTRTPYVSDPGACFSDGVQSSYLKDRQLSEPDASVTVTVEPSASSEALISEASLAELIDAELVRLREERLQSDERFAESFVRYRKTRGFAYLHIRADLLGRGVAESLIEETLLLDDPDWIDMAESLVEKKLQGYADREFGGKAHRKIMRFLESRGYPSGAIREVLDPKFPRGSRSTNNN